MGFFLFKPVIHKSQQEKTNPNTKTPKQGFWSRNRIWGVVRKEKKKLIKKPRLEQPQNPMKKKR